MRVVPGAPGHRGSDRPWGPRFRKHPRPPEAGIPRHPRTPLDARSLPRPALKVLRSRLRAPTYPVGDAVPDRPRIHRA
jgi:hypothetical protein